MMINFMKLTIHGIIHFMGIVNIKRIVKYEIYPLFRKLFDARNNFSEIIFFYFFVTIYFLISNYYYRTIQQR